MAEALAVKRWNNIKYAVNLTAWLCYSLEIHNIIGARDKTIESSAGRNGYRDITCVKSDKKHNLSKLI